MAGIVVDTSALFPLYVPDEDETYTRWVLQQAVLGETLTAPVLCLVEFGNSILNAVRKRRLTETEAADAHRDFALLPVGYSDFNTPEGLPTIHALAQRRRLTFYDATYLALALSQGARLASLDEALKVAAVAEGVTLV